jgi:hypothetical protein
VRCHLYLFATEFNGLHFGNRTQRMVVAVHGQTRAAANLAVGAVLYREVGFRQICSGHAVNELCSGSLREPYSDRGAIRDIPGLGSYRLRMVLSKRTTSQQKTPPQS